MTELTEPESEGANSISQVAWYALAVEQARSGDRNMAKSLLQTSLPSPIFRPTTTT